MSAPMASSSTKAAVRVGSLVAFEYTATAACGAAEDTTTWLWTLGTVTKINAHKRLVTLGCWDPPRRTGITPSDITKARQLDDEASRMRKELAGREREHADYVDNVNKEAEELVAKTSATEGRLELVRPALEEAKTAVNQINAEHLREMRSYTTPPEAVKKVLEAVTIVMGNPTNGWEPLRAFIRRDDLIPTIRDFDPARVTAAAIATIEKSFLTDTNFTFERASRASKAAGPMYLWVIAQIKYAGTLAVVTPLLQELEELKRRFAAAEATRRSQLVEINRLRGGILSCERTREELLYGTAPLQHRSKPGTWSRPDLSDACIGKRHMIELVILKSSILRVLRDEASTSPTFELTAADVPPAEPSDAALEQGPREVDDTNPTAVHLSELRVRALELEAQITSLNESHGQHQDELAVVADRSARAEAQATKAAAERDEALGKLHAVEDELARQKKSADAQLIALTAKAEKAEKAAATAAGKPRHIDPARPSLVTIATQTEATADQSPPMYGDADDDLELEDDDQEAPDVPEAASEQSSASDDDDQGPEPSASERTIALTELKRFSYVATAFSVEKIAASSIPFPGARKLRRTWVVDLMKGHVLNCNLGASSPSKTFPIKSMAMIEKHVTDPCRLRVLFGGVGHDHDVRFQTGFARERFVELVQCCRPGVIVHSPELASPHERTSLVVRLDEAPSMDVDVGSGGVITVGGAMNGEALRIQASMRMHQPVRVWCGSHALGGADESCDTELLDSWLPRGVSDVYAAAVHNSCAPAIQAIAVLEAHLGEDFVMVATIEGTSGAMAVFVRRTLLSAVSNAEGSKVMIDADGNGVLAVGLHLHDTSLLFVCFRMAQTRSDEQKFDDMEAALASLELWGATSDASSSADHVFAFGEFNCSLGADDAAVSKSVSTRDFATLLAVDSFSNLRQARPYRALARFIEPRVAFSPTCFTEAGPRYASRVLHYSPPGYAAKCLAYEASEFLVLSQALPVAAMFRLSFRRPCLASFEAEHEPVYRVVLSAVTLVSNNTDNPKYKNLQLRVGCRLAATTVLAKDAVPTAEGLAFVDTSALSFDLVNHMALPVCEEYIRLTFVGDRGLVGTAVVKLCNRVGPGTKPGVDSMFRCAIIRSGGAVARCTGKLRWTTSSATLFEGVQ